jgi:membrane protein YdbS with pleckstrin-like domain
VSAHDYTDAGDRAIPGAPATPLSPRALTQWRLEALGGGLAIVVAALVLRAALDAADAPGVIVDSLVPVALLAALVAGLTVPGLRWRHWRYDVTEEEIDIQHGAFTIVRTIVPMARVQHVETRRTFTSQVFQTATLVLHTAGGAVEIPLLDDPVATELRDRIALYARTPDADDEPTRDDQPTRDDEPS